MSRQAGTLHVLIATVILILLLSACSSPPRQKLPAQLSQAERHNLAGVAAERKNSFQDADARFTEAYRLFAAVENYQGMLTTLINSSRLHRRQGDIGKAEKDLKQAAGIKDCCPDLETELYFENCKLALLKGDKDGALGWAEQGLRSAKDPDRASMLNLAAGVQLQKGNHKKALEMADIALETSRSRKDRQEEANALRLMGEAAFLESRYKDALPLYKAALTIDKELAVPGKVYADLSALHKVAAALGDVKRSAEYLQRAIDAAIADRKVSVAAEDMDRLIKLHEQSGNSQAAGELLKSRRDLPEAKKE
jgi:tetratricopeptide (TPR) repeat protein